MSTSEQDYMTPDFREHLKNISKHWAVFCDKIENWIKEDNLMPDFKFSKEYVKEEQVEYSKLHNAAKNAVIRKYISSTHIWVEGKSRWSKKYDNWYQNPYECKVCKIGASGHEEIGWAGEMAPITDIPTHDMHGQSMHRTCAEVQAARAEAKKKHKGGKCRQCSAFGCLLKDC